MIRIGVDLGGHTILAAAVDFDGGEPHILSKLEAATPSDRDLNEVTSLISRMVISLADGEPVTSVGVGVPGFVCRDRRRVARLTNFNSARDVDFASMLESALTLRGCGAEVFIENDANCAALGEGFCGAARGCRDYIVLTLGTGVGSGIVANGTLVAGAHGMGGEAGHMALTNDDTLCGCGGRGHVESAASADWTETRAAAAGLPADFKLLWERRDESTASDVLEPALDALARCIASLAAVTDPELVVISGGMSRAAGLADELRARSERYLSAPFRSVLRIEISKLCGEAAVIGAAGLWKKGFLY